MTQEIEITEIIHSLKKDIIIDLIRGTRVPTSLWEHPMVKGNSNNSENFSFLRDKLEALNKHELIKIYKLVKGL